MQIYTLWDKGLAQAPELIQRLNALWIALHDEGSVKVLNGEEMDALIAQAGVDPSNLTVQVRSDLVRLILLADGGGVWVDATLLPSAPLGTWLTTKLGPAGFYAHSTPKSDRILDSWFLSAHPDNVLVAAWRDTLIDYFRTPRLSYKLAPKWDRLKREIRRALAPASFASDKVARNATYFPYHIVSYTLDNLCRTKPEIGEIWRRVPKDSGEPAMRLKAECNRTDGDLDEATLHELIFAHPVHKLNWRTTEKYEKAVTVAERALL